ncbi:MAG: histidinol-phosphate transaminase [Gammaproteobacteria bacterium]|jgi:histidinol-phosphate aminotransferase|nr:histidinol-phosphate transaminase [Gammaproteobacteria bacterium]MDG2337082.1 histidinol-phosphate transaminase [Gammaproteobacteria bacterium]
MKMTRRGFVGTIGLGSAAGLLSSAGLTSRHANAASYADEAVYDGGIMQLNQNESARGPGPKTMEAIRSHVTKRVGRGYAPDHVNELRSTLAEGYGVSTDNVILATGSGPLLVGATRAFCSANKPLATIDPTYTTAEQTARQMGVGIRRVPVDGSNMGVDLDGLAKAAVGAGMVYFCNPNNPTGTVHSPAAVESFVRRVQRESPNTRMLIDEAYINYAADEVMQTALPLALEFENVFITRSFSKAHGMAGLRVGYALGQKQTLDAITGAWGMGDVNMLSAIAAITAFKDKEHIEWERQENTEIRAFVVAAFNDMGFEATNSHTNHIFVNLGRPAKEFRDACLEHKILVGRDFPPFHNTHCRISMGSREEMQQAVEVFRKVLA